MRRILRTRGRAYVVLTAAILGAAIVIAAALLRDGPARDGTTTSEVRESALLITSEPDGALVWVDGEERGITPLRVRDLAEGRHRVHLEKEGFTPLASGDAEFSFGGETTFHAVLSAVEPVAAGDAGGAFGGRRGGQRDPVAGGGGPKPQNAVEYALAWLAAHQSQNGSWDADGFETQCKLNKCTGPGEDAHDVGVTGLALLAFLGAGETHTSGRHQEVVKKGLRYLKSVQTVDGRFGPQKSVTWMYDHLAATLAMTEAYALTESPLFEKPAQLGVSFTMKAQNPYLGWRYGVRDGDNDTSVTTWAVMVLRSAKMAGLAVDEGAFRGAMAWIEKMTDPESGRIGYQRRGGSPARTQETMDRFPADQVETLTAMGVLVRIYCGQDPAKNEWIQKGAELLAKKPPKWTGPEGSTDFTYWMFGSWALHKVGGHRWKDWSNAIRDQLVANQNATPGRDERGSWDPVDPWSAIGGRVYATAMNCLTLETHLRYDKVFGGK